VEHYFDEKETIPITLGKFKRIWFDFNTKDDSEGQAYVHFTAIHVHNILKGSVTLL